MKDIRFLKTTNVVATEILTSFSRFFYSSLCIVCQSTELNPEQHICGTCWHQLPVAKNSGKITAELSFQFNGKIYFKQAISLWEFSDEVQRIIHFLKYNGYWKLAQKIGWQMGIKLKQTLPLNVETILLPIPLHKTRARERGYNQSDYLTQYIAAETNLKWYNDVLQRTRYTESQTRLNAAQRQENVAHAFQVIKPEKIKHKNIVLIDDVLTTGATMNACARELLNNGANIIYIFSAAKA